MRSLPEQLNDAFERSGLSVQQLSILLLEKSGLEIERSSLQRKLKGKLRLNTDEAQALATVLGVTLVWMPGESTDDKVEGAA